MPESLDEILDAVTENDDGAMIIEPATAKELRLCQKDMAEMGFPPIPQGCAAFLRKLNGFAWNGIAFFSTDRVLDNETGFMLDDIVSANESFAAQNEGFGHCVYLGRSDEDLYVYNTKNGRYEVLDQSGLDVMEDFETFPALFAGVVLPRI